MIFPRLNGMPRFYFNLYNDMTSIDEEGLELPNAAVALQRAARIAREMAAESVRNGHLVLDHRLEVTNEDGQSVGTVHFRDVVRVVEHETRH
jgi:hypothetical protein